MERLRDGIFSDAALKLSTLAVAEFMLFEKLHIAAAAATITAIPTPVSARNVA
jgi:hypothetical protein